MTIAAIIELVKDVTTVQVDRLGRKVSQYPTYARYVTIVLMNEEGYSNSAIGASLNMSRIHIYRALEKISDLLDTDKEFKKMYMACIACMAKMEEEII